MSLPRFMYCLFTVYAMYNIVMIKKYIQHTFHDTFQVSGTKTADHKDQTVILYCLYSLFCMYLCDMNTAECCSDFTVNSRKFYSCYNFPIISFSVCVFLMPGSFAAFYNERECYGGSFRVPFRYTPPLFKDKLYFTPSKGGPMRLVMDKGEVNTSRCHVFVLSPISRTPMDAKF